MHVIEVGYVTAQAASMGWTDTAEGHHSIKVDGRAFAAIRAGNEIRCAGAGFTGYGGRPLRDEWVFNYRGPGTAMFFAMDGDYQPEDFEAISIKHDGIAQARPKGYWD